MPDVPVAIFATTIVRQVFLDRGVSKGCHPDAIAVQAGTAISVTERLHEPRR